MLVGIDIGGTKIAISLGTKEGKITHSSRLQTQLFSSGKEGISKIVQAIYSLLKEAGKEKSDIKAIGISSPGPVDVKKGKMITPPNLPSWHHTDIVAPFVKEFKVSVFMNNDANAAALAEYHFGKRKNIADLVYLTASTGMGGGIIVNHSLVQGITDTAGEIGHIVLDIQGPLCPCGMRGCFEVYCGGANVANRAQKAIVKEKRASSIAQFTKGQKVENIDMESIIEAAKNKDALAIELWEEFVTRLAQGIGTIIMIINPQAVILGTIAVHTKNFLMDPLLEQLSSYSWPYPLEKCIIEPSNLGEKISTLAGFAVAVDALKCNQKQS